MPKEILKVTKVFEGKVSLKTDRLKMCSCCSLFHFCGNRKDDFTVADQGISYKPGDKVEVEISEGKIVSAGLIIFLLPAMIFLVSLVGFRRFGELRSFLLALGVVSVYYITVKLSLRKWGKRWELKVIKKCES
ncbi:MAG: SoxR reducing system RseC family protein [Candidatus Omnitrophica bacterium]|nr:SoxR reducing system RseC family protein [Candidatus Omnitrophota bacterium]MBU2044442.1 SoxR reducing system RseC family protein [Candidatus Omnitrophota bacterium]MBU2250712.1 SoxR reducing system RseC family protein [Candidatus Omnitrophota bacterium]MBU2265483.1 SoxR reducing system RseC family protein [Candidatus Omnitrophota bacterium]MBU2473718.1 SoxR reducing system RseC family protein [Candidatus Omnitrophota bacterium]